MITIKDIARLSGCSISTVSRVLNNHSDVSQETKDKVMAIVNTHNFVPNANAKKLKQKSKGIAILVKGARNSLFAEILERIQGSALLHDIDVSVFYNDEDSNEVQFALKTIQEIKPKGLIFLGGNLEYFQNAFDKIKTPSVLITNTAKDLAFDNLSSFTTDDRSACEYIADYIVSKGHKRIGIVGGNADNSITQVSYRRILGIKDAFEKHHIKFEESKQYAPCHFSSKDGYEATKKLLKSDPHLTAIMALSDNIAIGALRAICDLGLRVPEDISLTGYDGLDISSYLNPRITTIRQDSEHLALDGIKSLLDQINYGKKKVDEVVPFTFVEGASVKKIEG